jgi:hypothetical protein
VWTDLAKYDQSWSQAVIGAVLRLADPTPSRRLGGNRALLGNYMAESFDTAVDGHGGLLLKRPAKAGQQPLLTHPVPQSSGVQDAKRPVSAAGVAWLLQIALIILVSSHVP